VEKEWIMRFFTPHGKSPPPLPLNLKPSGPRHKITSLLLVESAVCG